MFISKSSPRAILVAVYLPISVELLAPPGNGEVSPCVC